MVQNKFQSALECTMNGRRYMNKNKYKRIKENEIKNSMVIKFAKKKSKTK